MTDLSSTKEEAFKHLKEQQISLEEVPQKIEPSEYLCSALSSVQRIPAFEYVSYNNKALVKMAPHKPDFDKIILDPSSGFLIIPLLDPKL